MNELRVLIQQKLEEIQNLKVTPEVPDEMLEEDKTYFSFTLQKTYIGSDTDKNFTYRVNLMGYIKRLNNLEENTIEIIDNIADEIEKKLKELNLKCNYIDVSAIDSIRKIQITGEVIYNELNKVLV